MKRKLNILLIFMLLLATSAFNNEPQRDVDLSEKESRLPSLKDSINIDLFIDFLEDSIWRERDAYDAAHILLIPLYYAIEFKEETLLNSYRNHFEKLIQAYNQDIISIDGLKELQYLSLASRFLVLDENNDHQGLHSRLFNLLNKRYLYYWEENPAWQWARDPFPGGIKERIHWKLNNVDSIKKYYNVLHDADFFVMGIGADLYTYSLRNNKNVEKYKEVISLFHEIMVKRLDQNVKGWVFQLGYWSDHRDLNYSGYLTEPNENSPAITAQSLQADASHSHRWPLWLSQFSNVTDISKYQAQLEYQLLNIVIEDEISQKMNIPILNNYMCGHNGYYRWNYSTHKNSSGYGPYKLSGTFGLGWWSLIRNEKLADYYLLLYDAYPLNEANVSIYEPISTRKRHTIVKNSNRNGLRKQIALMAAFIASNHNL